MPHSPQRLLVDKSWVQTSAKMGKPKALCLTMWSPLTSPKMGQPIVLFTTKWAMFHLLKSRVIDRAVPQISQLLRPQTGAAYLVTVDDNRPAQLAHLFQQQQQSSSRDSKQQLSMEPLFRRRARNEYLTIQKIFWGSTS
jgi:hypothetical protein